MIVSYVITELALCFLSSPGRFTALRGFAFLVVRFSFHLSAETRCRFGWVCTQGWIRIVFFDSSQDALHLYARMRFFLARTGRGVVKPDQQSS